MGFYKVTRWLSTVLLVFGLFGASVPLLHAASSSASGDANGIQLMEKFDRKQAEKSDGVMPIDDHRKHEIMFYMGVPLIILLLATGGIGIAVGVYGKPLFMVHIILAGLTVTLAIAHVIVGIAWFNPF